MALVFRAYEGIVMSYPEPRYNIGRVLFAPASYEHRSRRFE
jgi:hypothetical protein